MYNFSHSIIYLWLIFNYFTKSFIIPKWKHNKDKAHTQSLLLSHERNMPKTKSADGILTLNVILDPKCGI